jgi:hypothetical protein
MNSPEHVTSLMLFGSTPGLKNSQALTWIPRVAKHGLRKFLADTISDRFPASADPRHPVTLREYLTLMEALDADLAEQTVENFYYLSRAALVKDERNLDKFDRVFGTCSRGWKACSTRWRRPTFPPNG